MNAVDDDTMNEVVDGDDIMNDDIMKDKNHTHGQKNAVLNQLKMVKRQNKKTLILILFTFKEALIALIRAEEPSANDKVIRRKSFHLPLTKIIYNYNNYDNNNDISIFDDNNNNNKRNIISEKNSPSVL